MLIFSHASKVESNLTQKTNMHVLQIERLSDQKIKLEQESLDYEMKYEIEKHKLKNLSAEIEVLRLKNKSSQETEYFKFETMKR
jgi:hypothetical protein